MFKIQIGCNTMSIFAIINSLYGDYLSCKETSRRIFTLRVNCVYPYKQLFDWSIMECCSLYGSDWHTFVFFIGTVTVQVVKAAYTKGTTVYCIM